MSQIDNEMAVKRAHISRRSFLTRMVGLGAGAALLAACGGASNSGGSAPQSGGDTAAPAQTGGTVTISMMGWGSILEKDNVQAGLNLFEERNPGIKVNWMHTPEEYETKLKTMLAGGTPPDVFWTGNMADYVARDVVLDITDRVKNDPEIGKPDYFIQPQEEERAVINGKWYGIGSCWVMPHIYYNTEMFEEAGIQPPSSDPTQAWTWEQFIEIATQLTIDANGKHPNESDFDENNVTQWGVYWPTWSQMRDLGAFSNGGESYTKDYKVKLNSPEAMQGVQNIADLSKVHKVAMRAAALEQLGLNGMQMLASKRLAILVDGSWALQDLAKMDFKFGTGVLPKMKEAVTVAQAHMHVIYKNTKHPEEAWKLLAFLSSDDYQLGLLKVGLWLPSHTSLMTEEGFSKWITPGVHPEGYKQLATDYLGKHARNYFYPAGFGEAEQIISSALDPVWIGEKTVEEALAESDAIAKAEEVLAKGLKDIS